MPPYSPDDNLVERLWKQITQEHTNVRYFQTFEALTERVEQALRAFTIVPEAVLALCGLPTEWSKMA